MDVSPKTIREVEFREKLRGYNPDDVDEFLERIAAGLEIIQERLRQATERAVRAEQRATEASEGDDAMRRTLVLAQRTADLAIQEAREQGVQLVAQAEAQAQSVRAEAAEQARRTIEEATREAWGEVSKLESTRDRLRGEIVGLERFLETERARLRGALSEALRRVDDAVPSLSEPPSFTDTSAVNGMRRAEVTASEPPAVAVTSGSAPPPPPPPPPPSRPAAPMQADDDTFLADLRMAVHDPTPLGSRDDSPGY